MTWFDWFLAAGLSALALMSALPFSRHPAWVVRVWDFTRLQAVGLALILLAVGVWQPAEASVLGTPAAALSVGALALHAWFIRPYSRLHRKEVPDAAPGDDRPALKLMAANVLCPSRAADRLLDLVDRYEPDILVTLETDAWWQKALGRLRRTHPHGLDCPLDNLYGMHLYSRHPLVDARIQYLVQDDVPSMHARLDLPAGESVYLHFVHPAPPSPTENETSVERDAELVVLARALADAKAPVIVAGDLNDVAWSRTTTLFRKVSGLLDLRVGRGLYNTFHTGIPVLRFPLDHVFVSSHFSLRRLERLPDFGSDHFPIFCELVLHRAHVGAPAVEPANGDDRAEADELVERAGDDLSPDDVHQPRRKR